MTAAELLFKIRTEGTDELKKVQTATQSVGEGTRLAGAALKTFDSTLNSLVASGKTFRESLEAMSQSQGVLSSAVRGTARELLDQIKAAEGDRDAMRRLKIATDETTASTLEARAAVQALDGRLSAMAAGRWLATIEGLGPILHAAFAIAGPLAFFEIIEKGVEKIDPLKKAEEELTETTKKLNTEYAELEKRFERLQIEDVTAKFGKAKGLELAGFYANSDKYEAQAQIKDYQRQIDQIRSLQKGGVGDAMTLSTLVADNAWGGVTASLPGFLGQLGGSRLDAAANAKVHELEQLQDLMQFKMGVDDAQAKADRSKEDKVNDKPGIALGKRRAEEEIRLRHELGELKAKETTGVSALVDKEAAEIQNLRDKNLLTKENLNLIRQIAMARADIYFNTTLPKELDEASLHANGLADTLNREQLTRSAADMTGMLGDVLPHALTQANKDDNTRARIAQIGDAGDADSVRRGVQETTRRNQLSVAGGQMSGGNAALADLNARVEAAKAIYDIETRSLNLIFDKDKRDEAYAESRKKRAEEVYQAEAQYVEAIAALREKDLVKYRDEAGSIFDALSNRREGAGYALRQMFQKTAVSQGRILFENATTPILQSVGHTIGGLTGGSSFGGLLNRTILDPKNGNLDPAQHAQVLTEKHTADSAAYLHAIYQTISGSPAAVPGTSAGGELPANTSNSSAPLFSSVLSSISGVTSAVGGGSSSSSTKSFLNPLLKFFGGDSGTMGGFSTGLSTVASGDALNLLIHGGIGPNGTAAQVGAGVGLAGAIGTGAMGIASGVSQGGAAGGLKAAGSAAGMAGTAIASISKLMGVASGALSMAGPIGALAGMGLSLIGGLFGDNKVKRQNEINKELSSGQYMAPTALNVTQSSNGTYEDFDAHGLLRTSTLKAVPAVTEPSIWQQTHGLFGPPPTYYPVPGGVTSPFSGSPTSGNGGVPLPNNGGPTIIIQGGVNAIDPKSFKDVLNSPEHNRILGDAMATHLQTHEGRASAAIRFVANQ